MAYYKKRKPRKETTAQALARYKRQQEKQRKQREARLEYERASCEPAVAATRSLPSGLTSVSTLESSSPTRTDGIVVAPLLLLMRWVPNLPKEPVS